MYELVHSWISKYDGVQSVPRGADVQQEQDLPQEVLLLQVLQETSGQVYLMDYHRLIFFIQDVN